MQIVIDIPDEKYDRLLYQDIISLRSYVENGIVLPKGHGDLIDRRELLKLPIDKANYPSNYVKYAPTIIEKDGN